MQANRQSTQRGEGKGVSKADDAYEVDDTAPNSNYEDNWCVILERQ